MTPEYLILANNVSIMAAIQSRFVSLKIVDEVGFNSDTLDLSLDDRDGLIEIPKTGVKLDVSMGYKETGLTYMGQYVVDEIALEGPPNVLHIKGHAADLKQSLKTQQVKSWRATTIGELVNVIAGKHGYTAKVSEAFKDLPVPHLDQTESDLHLLTRLATQFGAIAKPAGGHLVFTDIGSAKSVSGKDLPALVLTPSDITKWKLQCHERDAIESVEAHWYDSDTAETKIETIGTDGITQTLRPTYRNADQAKAAATAHHTRLKRTKSTLYLNCIGNPNLCAETPITLSGFRAGLPTEWIITHATHAIDNAGYTTTLDAAINLSEKPDTSLKKGK